MTFEDARRRIEAALREPLPGFAAQRRLAPVPAREWPAGSNPARIRNAAGLLLIFPGPTTISPPALPGLPAPPALKEREALVVLTQRAETLRHPGQISLPGGVVESGETFEQAALREAHEEIGLSPDLVTVLGELTPVDIHVSGFRLHPIVGLALARPELRPADGEVARVIEVPLATLLDPARVAWRTLERNGQSFEIPTLLTGDAEIWGATAMVLAEFLTLLGWRGPAA